MAEPNWPPIKARFEKGEHPDDLAKAFKVEASTIRNKAKRDKWDRSMQRRRKPKPQPPRTPARESQPARSPAREQVAEAITAVTASMSVECVDASAYEDQHRDDFQALRGVAVTLLKNLGSLFPQDQARQLAAISTALKTVQEGQRKALRLDAKQDTTQGDFDAAMQELDQRANPTLQVPDVP